MNIQTELRSIPRTRDFQDALAAEKNITLEALSSLPPISRESVSQELHQGNAIDGSPIEFLSQASKEASTIPARIESAFGTAEFPSRNLTHRSHIQPHLAKKINSSESLEMPVSNTSPFNQAAYLFRANVEDFQDFSRKILAEKKRKREVDSNTVLKSCSFCLQGPSGHDCPILKPSTMPDKNSEIDSFFQPLNNIVYKSTRSIPNSVFLNSNELESTCQLCGRINVDKCFQNQCIQCVS